MKNLLTTSFLAIILLGGVIFAQGNNSNSYNQIIVKINYSCLDFELINNH
jgi:hypothetical protein